MTVNLSTHTDQRLKTSVAEAAVCERGSTHVLSDPIGEDGIRRKKCKSRILIYNATYTANQNSTLYNLGSGS